MDCGRALAAWSEFRSGKRKGNRVGFPRFKKKTAAVASFRLRNKHPKGRPPSIRVGDNGRARSITLPGIGVVAVHDDTRQLRRMLAKGRAKVLCATVSQRAGRWWVSLNVEAADLHPGHAHPVCDHADVGGWVGVDRGLSAPPRPRDLRCRMGRVRPDAGLQTTMAGRRHRHRRPLVSIKQTLLGLRVRQRHIDVRGSGIHLPLRTLRRQRHQRGGQPRALGRQPPPNPGPPSRRPGHQCPPTGRR